MKAKNVLLLTTSCLLTISNCFAQFCFAKNFVVDTVSFAITAADFNKDGNPDLATVNMGTNVLVSLGNGKGGFATPAKFTTGFGSMSVISEDFNKDGNLDLATANMMDMNVSVLLGNGKGSFTTVGNYSVANTPYMLISADFNKDGNLDIATANNGSGNVSVLLGNGKGGFANAVNSQVSSKPGSSSIASADFNKDGNPDLVVGNSDTNYVSIMLGHGDSSFSTTSTLKIGTNLSSAPQSVICIDLNKDGKVDVVSANSGDNTVSVLLGNGNGTFAADTNFQVTSSGHQNNYPQSIIASDFNGDGKIDLATANLNSYDVSVLLNNGAGGFQDEANYAVGVFPYVLVSADFNKDGEADIAVANAASNYVSILLNCSPPLGITNLTQTISINSYPNPSNGKFQLTINNLELTKNYQLGIYNIQGEKIFYSTIQQVNPVIDISNQPNGIYFLQLRSENGTAFQKIIIQQ